MANLYGQVTQVLKEEGWFLHHQGKGSHEIWRRQDDPDGAAISVPSNLKKRPTAESILKQAGLPKGAYKTPRRKRKRRSGAPEADGAKRRSPIA